MTCKALSLAVACCLFVTAECHAVWTFHHVKPEVEEIKEDMVRFVAVRTPPENDAQLDRSARLTISDGKRNIVVMSVEPTTNDRGDLTYAFQVAKEYLPHTRLEVFEKEREKRHVVGGGAIYCYATRRPYLDLGLKALNEPIKLDSD